MSAAELLRITRSQHRVTQTDLARRCGTSQAQISRIERGATSPSVNTLAYLLSAMGEQLELSATPGPLGNQTDADRERDMALTPAERVIQAAELSYALTTISAGRLARR
jgi:transcriptional regulator with XRE-family HTH domain